MSAAKPDKASGDAGKPATAGKAPAPAAKPAREPRATYRVENTAGELIGTVRATDEGDAYREAARKFGGMLRVRLR